MENAAGVLLLIAATSFAVPACVAGGGAPAVPSATAGLENTLWKLLSLGDMPAAALPEGWQAAFTLVGKDARVQGSTGCNRLMGGYALDGDRLSFRGVATTQMACLEGGEQEALFLKALEATAGWRIQGETLELRDGQGAVVASFTALYPR